MVSKAIMIVLSLIGGIFVIGVIVIPSAILLSPVVSSKCFSLIMINYKYSVLPVSKTNISNIKNTTVTATTTIISSSTTTTTATTTIYT